MSSREQKCKNVILTVNMQGLLKSSRMLLQTLMVCFLHPHFRFWNVAFDKRSVNQLCLNPPTPFTAITKLPSFLKISPSPRSTSREGPVLLSVRSLTVEDQALCVLVIMCRLSRYITTTKLHVYMQKHVYKSLY